MKRILVILSVVAIFVVSAIAADSNHPISFETMSHEFGNIKSDGGKVSCEFVFTNTSKEPVAIMSVTNGGCGCTTPSYPHKPIAPGEKGVIKITFNPEGRRGEFNRQVKVRYALAKKRGKLELKFSGVVIP